MDNAGDDMVTVISPQPGNKATGYVAAIVVLCLAFAAFVLILSLVRPSADNPTLIATVAGVVTPVILGLLAATVQQVHLAVNSRLTQLLSVVSAAKLAEGKLAGQATVETKIVEKARTDAATGSEH